MRMADLIPRGWDLLGETSQLRDVLSVGVGWCRNSFEHRGQTSLGHLTEIFGKTRNFMFFSDVFLDVLAQKANSNCFKKNVTKQLADFFWLATKE